MSDYEELYDYALEVRNLVLPAIIDDEEHAAALMSRAGCVYPPDEDFEYYDWQAAKVMLALAKAGALARKFSADELAQLEELAAECYSPCTLDPALVVKL